MRDENRFRNPTLMEMAKTVEGLGEYLREHGADLSRAVSFMPDSTGCLVAHVTVRFAPIREEVEPDLASVLKRF
jgi:hypothetical protein